MRICGYFIRLVKLFYRISVPPGGCHPPASAEAAATTPSLSQPEGWPFVACGLDEESDSKEFVVISRPCRRINRLFLVLLDLHIRRSSYQIRPYSNTGKIISNFVLRFSKSMLCCIYSGDGDDHPIAPVLEVSCVTGLPARTARPFVPSFFLPPGTALPSPI